MTRTRRHGARARGSGGARVGRTDREVGEPVAVEVPSRKRCTEVIAVSLRARWLVDSPIASRADTRGTSVEDRDRSCPERLQILAGTAYRQVGEPVAVEIAVCNRRAEAVPGFGALMQIGPVLVEKLRGRLGEPIRGPVEHVDGPRLVDGPDDFHGNAHCEVGESIAVEVGGRDGCRR